MDYSYLLQLSNEVREEIVLNFPSIRDVIVMGMLNKELLEWLRSTDIIVQWERKHLGPDDNKREFVMRHIATWINLSNDGNYLTFDFPIENTVTDEERIFKRIFPDATRIDDDDDDWLTFVVPNNYENRIRNFQFYYQASQDSSVFTKKTPRESMLWHTFAFYRDIMLKKESNKKIHIDFSRENDFFALRVESYTMPNIGEFPGDGHFYYVSKNPMVTRKLIRYLLNAMNEEGFYLEDEHRNNEWIRSKCVSCKVKSAQFVCGQCRLASYCGATCQEVDWVDGPHRRQCCQSQNAE